MSQQHAAIFPVTITRVGGIAGFNDTIVVESSGATTVTDKRGTTTSCTLNGTTLQSLEESVQAGTSTPPSPTTNSRISDRMTIAVTTAESSHPISLGDAQGVNASIVNDLINDVTGASPAYRLCTKS